MSSLKVKVTQRKSDLRRCPKCPQSLSDFWQHDHRLGSQTEAALLRKSNADLPKETLNVDIEGLADRDDKKHI
jgi:hypothetical protein